MTAVRTVESATEIDLATSREFLRGETVTE